MTHDELCVTINGDILLSVTFDFERTVRTDDIDDPEMLNIISIEPVSKNAVNEILDNYTRTSDVIDEIKSVIRSMMS